MPGPRHPPQPPDDNDSCGEGSWLEYRKLHVETLDWLVKEVREQHDQILVMKVRFGMIAIAAGSVSGLLGAVIVAFVLKVLKLN